jgi:hypothetical protein
VDQPSRTPLRDEGLASLIATARVPQILPWSTSMASGRLGAGWRREPCGRPERRPDGDLTVASGQSRAFLATH